MAVSGFSATDYLERLAAVWPGQKPFLVSSWGIDGVAFGVAYSLGTQGSNDHRFTQTSDASSNVRTFERSTTSEFATGSAMPSGAWFNHGSAWVSNSSREVWLNGGGKVSDTSFLSPNAPNNTRIGINQDAGSIWSNTGGLAEVSVWDVAGFTITDRDNLAALLATLVGGLAPNPLAVNAQVAQPWTGALVAYWRLTGPGDIQDLSGNGHHMSVVGTLTNHGTHPPVAAVPGEIWVPVLTSDFTGTNGNPPDPTKWAVSGTGANSSATIQSNALQLAVTGTPGGFVEPKVISTPGTGNVLDGRLDADTTVGVGKLFHNLKVRVSVDADDEIRVTFSRTADGNSLNVALIKEVNSVLTTIHQQTAIAADVSSQWLVRHEIRGNIMRYAVRPFAGGAIPEGDWDGQATFTDAELAVLSPVQINLASDEAATVVVDNVVISLPGLAPPSNVSVNASGEVSWTNGETERLKAYASKQGGSGLTYTLAVFESTETQPLQIIEAVTAPEGAGTYDVWLTHFTGDPEDPTVESVPSNVDTFVVGVAPETPVLSTPTINSNGNPALSVSSGGGDTTDIDLERSPAGAGTWAVIHTFGVFGGVFEDATAAADTQYDYRAVANGPGGTATSNVETITVPPDPPTTGSFVATSFHGGTVTHDLNTAGTTTEAVEVTLQWPEDSFVFTIPLSATVPFTVPFVLEPSTAYTPTFRSVGVDGNSAAFTGTADTTVAAPATAILLRVEDWQAPTAGDQALFTLLDGAPDGFSPVYVSWDQYPSLAPYKVLIVTPGGPNTEDLDNTVATASKPVLALRYALALLLADLGATTGETTTQITITDDTHPLAAGFPAGALTVLSAANNISGTTDAGLPAGAETVARRGVGATHWALFWVPQGGQLADGSLAPAHRAAFLLNDDASAAALSANGETIVLNAVRELLPAVGAGFGPLLAGRRNFLVLT